MPTAGKITINEGTGTNTATYSFTESAVTKHVGRVALDDGTGTQTGTAASPVRTDPTGSTTQPVSATSLPLPAGAATAAKQPALGTAGTPSSDVLTVQGSASGTAIPVSNASLPLPSGASTSANQATGNASLSSIDTKTPALGQALAAASVPVILPAATVTTLTPPTAVGLNAGANLVGKVGIDQTTPGTTNKVSIGTDGTVAVNAALPAGTNVIGKVTTDQTTHGTTDLVAADITKVAGTAIVNGGLAGSQAIGGTGAAAAAITQNPLNLGAKGVSAEATAVTTGQLAQLVTDLVGKLIVLPYANPENFRDGSNAAPITTTTATSILAAQGAGLRFYATGITITNSHATVGTLVQITDGSGGTLKHQAYAAPAGGGESRVFATPLRFTANTAVSAICATTGANVYVSVDGYIGS